jgi:predicted RNA-binding protein YlxR (DUF448 family)
MKSANKPESIATAPPIQGGVAEGRGGSATRSSRPRRTPIRSCVVCRQTSDKRALLRVVRLPEKDGGGVVVDPTGKRSGRGAYVCADDKCIDLAQKQRRFERALSVPAGNVPAEIFVELKALNAKNTQQVQHPS